MPQNKLKPIDRKEELASAQRDAVLITTTIMANYKEEAAGMDIKEEIIKWRNWFLNDSEFNNPPPSN